VSDTATVTGNNIPNGFLGNVTQGGPLPGGQNGGQSEGNRARIGDFSKFQANSGEFAGQAQESLSRMKPVLDAGPMSDPEGFRQRLGDDAQAQALAIQQPDPSNEGEVVDSDEARAEMASRFKQWDEWEKADDLAEPLTQKLVTVTVDGERYRIPVSEAVNGYMMQSDYSEKLRQLYSFRDQLQREKQGLDYVMSQLDKGDTFLDMMVQLGKFEGFAQAAIIYGTQMDAEQRMSPEQREVVQRERAQRARANKLEMRLRQLEQQLAQQQQPQRTRSEEYLFNQLNVMMPQAVQRIAKRGHEYIDSPLTRQIFERNWATMIENLGGKDLTTEFVENVLMSVIQDVQKMAKAGYIQAPKQSTAAAQLPPMSSLQGPTQPGKRRGQRERIGNISTMVHR
jgi:hypothetical protein